MSSAFFFFFFNMQIPLSWIWRRRLNRMLVIPCIDELLYTIRSSWPVSTSKSAISCTFNQSIIQPHNMVHHQIHVCNNISTEFVPKPQRIKDYKPSHIYCIFPKHYLTAELQCLVSTSFCHFLLQDTCKMPAKPSMWSRKADACLQGMKIVYYPNIWRCC